MGSRISRHLLKLAPQGGDLHITLGDRLRYPVESLVGGLHAVPPQRRWRPQHRYIGRRRHIRVERRPISGKFHQLAATAERSDHHPAEDDGGYGEHDDGHSMNRAMLGRMVMHAGAGQLPPGTALIAAPADAAEAAAALTAGADLIDLGDAPAGVIAEFGARHPGILVCTAGSPADVARAAAAARAAGALLVCPDADAAAASGMPADRILVEVLPARLPAVSAAGLAALVDVDHAAELAARQDLSDLASLRLAGHDPADSDLAAVAGIVAIAAVSSWLGASAVRTRHPLPVRHALDMTASIRGIRPPARTIRGLA